MFRLSAKFLISLGLTIFLLGMLMLAVEIKIVPNATELKLAARARCCETVAMTCSMMAQKNDLQALQAFLDATKDRNPDLLSAGVRRRKPERVLAATVNHETIWPVETEFPQECRVNVVIYDARGDAWGDVELAYSPVSLAGVEGYLLGTTPRLLGFIGSLAFMAFYFYLGKMLKVLNAKSVPQRVRTALNTLAGGLIVTDARGDIVLANDSLAAWVGVASDSLMGQNIRELPWTSNTDGEMPWNLTFTANLPVVGETARIQAIDGERTLIVNSAPMVGENDELRGVFIGLEDVTVLEQKEIEHKKLREEAERANSAKSEFLARMSHEIRTPMNAILGFTDVLRRGFDQDATERDEYLNTIHSSGEHLLSLINDILDLSKVESGRMELEIAKCSPHKIILETLKVLRVKAEEKGISLDYVPSDGLPEYIYGDSVRLRQIVTNLVGNAIKFTEKGSVEVRVCMTGRALELSVVDSGIGIKKEALSRIFQPFSQADSSVTRKFGGTGLGLAISKRFAEMMGGGIRVTSEVGVGTSFIVQLDPGQIDEFRRVDADEALSSLIASEATVWEADLQGCRILVVDDGDSNRKLLRLFLERAGAEIVEAVNGKEAVDLMETTKFEVVLMDMQMPVMDGYSAATLLRSRGDETPVVALTAHAMKEDEDKCIAAGCSHFLPKPINSNDLLRLVGEIFGGDVRVVEATHAPKHATTTTTTTATTANFAAPVAAVSEAATQPAELEQASPITSDLPMDDEEFCEIVVEFVERLRLQLVEMESVAKAGDVEELAKMAHWLKGAGGTAGFGEFTEPARQLEDYCKAGDVASLQPMLDQLQALAARIEVPVMPC